MEIVIAYILVIPVFYVLMAKLSGYMTGVATFDETDAVAFSIASIFWPFSWVVVIVACALILLEKISTTLMRKLTGCPPGRLVQKLTELTNKWVVK